MMGYTGLLTPHMRLLPCTRRLIPHMSYVSAGLHLMGICQTPVSQVPDLSYLLVKERVLSASLLATTPPF
jgi:hypothetical protein